RTPPEPLEIIGRKEKLKQLAVTYEKVPVNWDTHIDYFLSKASGRLYIIRICKYYGYSIENLDLRFQSLILLVISSINTALSDLLYPQRTRLMRTRSHNYVLPNVRTSRFKSVFINSCLLNSN
ncbi:unnamed protein product, partial [Porites evermanni]